MDENLDDETDDTVAIIDENEDESPIFVQPDLKIKTIKPSPANEVESEISIPLIKKKRDWSHLSKARAASKISRKASAILSKQKRLEEKDEKARLREIKRKEGIQKNRDAAKQRYRMKKEVDLEMKLERENALKIEQKKADEINMIKKIIDEDKSPPTRANTGLSYLDFSMYMNQYKRESQMIKQKNESQFKRINPPIDPTPTQINPPNYYNPRAKRSIDPNTLF